jgi:hypothetical protein
MSKICANCGGKIICEVGLGPFAKCKREVRKPKGTCSRWELKLSKDGFAWSCRYFDSSGNNVCYFDGKPRYIESCKGCDMEGKNHALTVEKYGTECDATAFAQRGDSVL